MPVARPRQRRNKPARPFFGVPRPRVVSPLCIYINEGHTCVLYLSPWQVRFVFKNLVEALFYFSLSFSPPPCRRCGAHHRKPNARHCCCARKCYSPPAQPQPNTSPRDANLLAAWCAGVLCPSPPPRPKAAQTTTTRADDDAAVQIQSNKTKKT